MNEAVVVGYLSEQRKKGVDGGDFFIDFDYRLMYAEIESTIIKKRDFILN